jgi:hypothetical protein
MGGCDLILPKNFTNKREFLSCLGYVPNFQEWSNLDFCHYFDHLLKMRHNSLQMCLCDAFFGKWVPERELEVIFPGYDSYGYDKTPDIVLVSEHDVVLIDVGVTKNYYETIDNKKNKYEPIIEPLGKYLKKEVGLRFFILDMDNYNFLTEQERLSDLLKGKILDENFFTTCLLEYDNKRKLVNENVDVVFFQNYMREKYGKNLDNIGFKKDTGIDAKFLEEIFNEKYPFSLNLDLKESEIIEFSRDFLSDKDKMKPFYDKKNDSQQYNDSYTFIMNEQKRFEEKKQITFYSLFPLEENILEKEVGVSSEQKMLFNFFDFFKKHDKISLEEPCLEFLRQMRENILEISKNRYSRNKFCFNYFESIEKDKENKEIFKHKKEQKSFYDFLKPIHGLPENISQTRPKSFIFNLKEANGFTKTHYFSSGTGYYKDKFKREHPSLKKTVDFESDKDIDYYLNYLVQENLTIYGDTLRNIESFLKHSPDLVNDSRMVKILKNRCLREIEPYFEHFLKKNYSKVLWSNHLFFSQLMHILSFTDKESQITMFNCGMPNKLCLVLGGYKSKDVQNPKAYMEIVLTKNPSFYKENVFGKLFKYKLDNNCWLVCTNWRRVTLDKCTFMRDSFYSVFSSSISFFENIGLDKEEYFDEITALKTMISLCPKQQVQELLMDSRYAIMSSFSIYTNIEELLKTKFSPPYYCALSVWIVKRLFNSLPKQTEKIMTDPYSILIQKPSFDGENVNVKRKGGKINLHSIWTNHELKNLEQVLEEIFIYVHTIKEPSNLYHEKIKAINTIIKFQEEFEKAGEEKRGKVNTIQEMKEFASSRFEDGKEKYIGYSSNVIYNSFKNLLEIIKPDFTKIIDDVLTESIGEIISTKAVIHDVGRHYKMEDNLKRSFAKRIFKRFKKINLIPEENENFDDFYQNYDSTHKEKKKFILQNMSNHYKVKARQKVWETILDILESNKNLNTVEEFLEYYLRKEKGELEADICIKSQYGSKREFYVINIAGKIYARIIEKFFYHICKVCSSECISIPGDKKMLEMQSMLDKATYYCTNNGMKMVYVNGDCTKWSAAETMGSFITMCEALKEYIPNGMYNLLRTGFSLWADKGINIPIELLEKIIPKNEYLSRIYNEDKISIEKPQIRSTQNFLQGMFNYASSIKASSCNYYMEKIWKIIYPETKLKVFHMEHSDDYVQIICFEKEEELEDYRALYKLMMKFHGYNDSARKTSCQSFFMEFVSLMSFNGHMLYPKIKKTKEINLSLPCTSYKSDAESALSRSGECLRMGCSVSFCFFFQRLHNYCLAEAYSLLEGMENYIERDIWNEPIEMFGLPEQFPLFSLYCKGNINNYRIYTYGGEEGKEKIQGLYTLANKNKNLEKISQNYENYDNVLYSPYFIYDSQNTIIKTFKKNFGLDYDFVKDFWEKNPEYRFIKPRCSSNLSNWLKVKFYDRAFIEAYTKVSRTRMTMRISRFVKNKCTKFIIDDEFYLKETDEILPNQQEEKETYTIKELYTKIIKSLSEEQIPMENPTKILLRADATSTTIYDFFDHLTIQENVDIINPNRNIGCLTPHKPNWIHLVNSPGILLQKILSPTNFELDGRRIKSETSLSKDLEQISKFFDIKKKMSPMEVQNLYNDLRICSEKRVLYMGFDRKNETMNESLTDQLMLNLTKNRVFNVYSGSLSLITNPFNEKKYYVSGQVFAENTYQHCLELITLMYVTLRRRYDMNVKEIRELLDTLKFKTKSEKDNEYVYSTWREILNLFHSNFFESIPTYLELRKQAAYLRHVLLNYTDTTIELVNSIYSYSYHYEQRAVYNNNRYVGRTICTFMYLGKTFRFKQKDNEIPTLYTNTKDKTTNKCAWWVCLRLANIITNNTFKYKLYTYNLKEYVKPIQREEKELCFLGYNNNSFYWEYNKEGKGIPIYFMKEKIPNQQYQHKLENEAIPRANEYTLRVYLGKHTLFRLPYWNCHQQNVVVPEKSNYNFEGINLKYFFKYKLFECILYNKKPFGLKQKHIRMDRNLFNQAQKFVAKCKINYDFFKKFQLGIELHHCEERLKEELHRRKISGYDDNFIFDSSFDYNFEKRKKQIEEDRKKREEVDESILDRIVLVEEEFEDDEFSIYHEDKLKFETEITDLLDQESEQAFIYKDKGSNIIEEDESNFLSSAKFQNFQLVIPKKEIIVDLKKNVFGPITNIYTYKPIFFNLIMKDCEDFNQNSEICFSNCLEVCLKYEELYPDDYKEKTYCLFLFLFYLSICHGDDKYLTTSKFHIKKDNFGFQFFSKGIFNKEKIEKRIGGDYNKIRDRILFRGKEIIILLKNVADLDFREYRNYNFRGFEKIIQEINERFLKTTLTSSEEEMESFFE